MYKSILLALCCSLLIACSGDLNVTNTGDIGTGDTDTGDTDTGDTDTGDTDTGDTDTGDTDTGDTDESGPRSLIIDDATDTATLGERQTTTVVIRDGSTNVEITAFGRTVTFTEDDFEVDEGNGEIFSDTYIKELEDGTEIILITAQGTWEGVHDGTHGYSYVVPYLVSLESEDTKEVLFNVYGDETYAQDMPENGIVKYRGKANGYSGPSSVADDMEFYEADVTLTADFESSTIHGSISAPEYFESETTGTFGLNIDETSITGNTFTTTLSVDTATCTTACPTISSSEVEGTFFGPSAEDVGGTYNLTGETADGEGYLDVGNFAGTQTETGGGSGSFI